MESFFLLCQHRVISGFIFFCVFFLSFYGSTSQPPPSSSSTARTDPTEAKAVNSMLSRWGLKASSTWNISGNLCSGAAIDSTDFEDPNFNPAIKCACSFNNGTTCHITQLKVYALNVVGEIPEEIRNLTFLLNLKISQNFLTGSLPAFIGDLKSMQYLTFGTNALSGPIPKELGNLKNLIVLGMGTNNFNGSIPDEFGNLTSLQQWYMDSSGVSGDLPSSLSKLKNLQTLWASDNAFTGRIPDFIGGWNLSTLRIQGNSFSGPIPSSLSKLSNLTDLRIGDIVNGSSSLAFISNMTSLSILILRNSMISDALPSNFTKYTNLQNLDLSFNNITGNVPQSLLNLSSLNILLLGNNSLTDTLPAAKSRSLSTIDLSYNQLSGSFPAWVSSQNLQLNLVGNNFVIDNSNSSVLPSGLECLQRSRSCFKGSPIYSQFAIKCGGSASITSFDGTTYEVDNATLTTASYYVTNQKKWAVSNVGTFADASNPTSNYIISSSSQFQNTLEPELYQTARMSPSSLRYYGLGLENGNYTVKLQFAEIGFVDLPTWQSVGRRVFNIYIQGTLKERDFDIRKAAGGKCFTAFIKEYQVPVIDNFLEIHLLWAGKGTCCVPTQGYYGPSISAISVSPFDFTPSVSNKLPSSSSSNKKALVVGIVVGCVVLGLVLFALCLWRRKQKRLSKDDEDLIGMDVKPITFSYAELKAATEDFNNSNLLGEGGFGPVYKGKLSDGRLVAVKQLSVTSHQGKRQFVAEIATISAVQHRNLVRLYGCCIAGDRRLLVYEFLENRSLDQAIFGSSLYLDWETRFEICLGTARGLAYLHEESSVRIVHRDVKSSNILLDANLNPKLSDFGLAKLYDDKKTHISTRVAGTIGYLAPEYAMRGHLTEKADVFGFGVVALEILSGRPNSDSTLDEERVYLLDWAWYLHEQKRELDLVDPTLSSYNEDEAARVIGIALLCTQASPQLRPPMSRVVAMLAGDIEVGEVKSKPSYLTEWDFRDISSNLATEDFSNSTETRFTNNQGSMPSDPNSMVSMSPAAPSTSAPMLTNLSTGEGR
ncbi:putative LRR receptor-like serine/threonine-protein kinase [Apostasia shenzhenica]|uniref:non-specific serine/threonine protein kinase n=1 Tax=Apostasia shenzhenica TaxID=1088818 RepID=A0A2I0AKG3_9ASPA|nr:putative LRR receptor-like serine/threonine-protein kinase [Apostasia shenzhenica]